MYQYLSPGTLVLVTTDTPPVCDSHDGEHDVVCKDRPMIISRVWPASQGYTVKDEAGHRFYVYRDEVREEDGVLDNETGSEIKTASALGIREGHVGQYHIQRMTNQGWATIVTWETYELARLVYGKMKGRGWPVRLIQHQIIHQYEGRINE